MTIRDRVSDTTHLTRPPQLVSIQALGQVATGTLRYGLVLLLGLWGGLKFAAFEAEAIRPLVENSPLLSWLYSGFGARTGSAIIGVIELGAAALILTRRWSPRLSAFGSLVAAGIFGVTLTFLISTPGALSLTSPYAGFLMKDILLLGASLHTAAEALTAPSLAP